MSGFEAVAAAAALTGLDVAKTVTNRTAEAKQAASQAAFLQGQADYQQRLAQTQEAALRRKQSRELSRMRALLAGRDIDIASGSALLTQEQAAADAEFDALLQRSIAGAEIASTRQQAGLASAKASLARRNAAFDIGTSLLSAGPNFIERRDKFKKVFA